MHALLEDAPSLESASARARTAWGEIALALKSTEIALIPRDVDAIALARSSSAVFLVVEGTLVVTRNSCALLCCEEGDLIGHTEISAASDLTAHSSFAVKALKVPLKDLFEAVAASPSLIKSWSALLAAQEEAWRKIAEHCAHRLSLGNETTPPVIRHYETGEIIIQQGGTNDEVYTLVEGSAEALVDGVKVGDIKSDEIFGAIAAIAGVPRTASVVATSRCMAISLPKGDFLHLLKTRPSTVLRLIQDMARALSNANDRVVGKMR
jgi:CRP-like cAMP-binding protein